MAAMEKSAEIHCKTTGKLLARRDEKGIYLWCKVCKTEHFIPWITKEEKHDKLASDADLCYNLSR